MKLMIGSAFLGLAAAQASEITTGANGIQVVRRDVETSVADIDVRIAEAVGEARVAAGVAAHNATMVATLAMNNQMAALQTSVASQIAAAAAANEAAASRMAEDMSTLQSTVVSDLSNADAAATVRFDGLSRSVSTALEDSVASTTTTLATTIAAINVNMTRGLANVPPSIHHSWHGGCSDTKYGGWHWVCLNRVTHDNAAPYFRKSSNERFSSLRPGMFQMITFSITRSSSWMHHRIELNGSPVYETHMHGLGHHRGGWWTDVHQDGMLRVTQAGHWWAMRVHSSSWQSWYPQGKHARIESHYLGKIE